MENELTQLTQGVVDPRRMGRNNSGLNEADVSDVMCILHPCSPAAFKTVSKTADRTPQHVLQNNGFNNYDDALSQSMLEEQETFIIGVDGAGHAMDLALRFSTPPITPKLGFVFGRNDALCDIVLANDTFKRVSNVHFSIFMNESGVLMLQDMSTNGTMVDDVLLKGRSSAVPQTRMLNSGAIIQVLSPKQEEVVKFIVRIPSREGHIEEYQMQFEQYMHRVATAGPRLGPGDKVTRNSAPAHRHERVVTQSLRAPLVHNQYGMHWSGGNKYNVVGLIGKGAFATVYQLATKSEGRLFAAKELEKRKFIKNGVLDRKLDNEMQIMQAISHPNIVQYVDYQDHVDHLYIIMEFVPCGDLQQYLTMNPPLSEELGRTMSFQVLDALAYLHAKKITHRDIKPDNILLASLEPDRFTVKLSDFGLSKFVKDDSTFLKTFCGTLLYCAPEVFPHYEHVIDRGQKRPRKGGKQAMRFHSYSQSVDIWSYGAVLWYSLCGRPPFEGVADADGKGMFNRIMVTPLDSAQLLERGVSETAVALLSEMLNTDPALRPTPAYCLRHPWFGHNGDTNVGPVNDGLGAIAEEDEDGGVSHGFDVSGLSIRDESGNQSSQFDEVSIHSGSMDFFDPRESKRFKPSTYGSPNRPSTTHPSQERMRMDSPTARQPSVLGTAHPRPAQRELCGEISQSALNAPRNLGAVVGHVVHGEPLSNSTVADGDVTQGSERSLENENALLRAARGAVASPSLLGAESLLRDVHMESPESSSDFRRGEINEAAMPKTPNESAHMPTASKTNKASTVHDEITPKQPQNHVFSRQINIPIPPSFWFDPNDPSTHNLEYASKVSGCDFVGQAALKASNQASMPITVNGSATEDEQEAGQSNAGANHDSGLPMSLLPPADFIKPPPRLGRLVSTEGSFAPITLSLTHRVTSWGRSSSNTIVYPDRNEIRVPKSGITLYFHAEGIEKLAEGEDFTKLPGLYCGIVTHSSAGLWINGVFLAKRDESQKTRYGRVHTGDEIVVMRDIGSKRGLTFTCEIFHGEGKDKRLETAPRFIVESEHSPERKPTAKQDGKPTFGSHGKSASQGR